MSDRAEFTTLTKLKASYRYMRCPGLIEMRIECGRPLTEGCEWDHIKRCEIEPDNSPENARPLCPLCHRIKTAMDAKQAAKGRRLRGENKPKRKAQIRSKGFPSKDERERAKLWKEQRART